MEVKLVTLKKLLRQVSPFGMTAAVLQLDGYGKMDKKDVWRWNDQVINELGEEETLKLINELTLWIA